MHFALQAHIQRNILLCITVFIVKPQLHSHSKLEEKNYFASLKHQEEKGKSLTNY